MTKTDAELSECENIGAEPDVIARVLAGEVIVARNCMAGTGLFEEMMEDAVTAIRGHMGEEVTAAILNVGFERVHEIVSPDQIPAMTDAIYRVVEAKAAAYLTRLMPAVFGCDTYFYEAIPNVRFHIPYESARKHAGLYKTFAKTRGEGKLTAHGPHRDSWLDCPDNGANVWIAFGRVCKGNGLTVFTKQYRETQSFTEKGSVTDEVAMTEPLTFDLEPGDCILFHTDHLHGSELNRTNETRFVISFRVTFDKPHFPREHYHGYRHSGLAAGPLKFLAPLPSILQPSFVRSSFRRAAKRLFKTHATPALGAAKGPPAPVFAASLNIGEIRPIDSKTCVARLDDGTIVGFGRRCPHEGADLAKGFVAGSRIICPWHNLPFDAASGHSPCTGLRVQLATLGVLDNGRITVSHQAASPDTGSHA